jgi:hypothetical protein
MLTNMSRERSKGTWPLKGREKSGTVTNGRCRWASVRHCTQSLENERGKLFRKEDRGKFGQMVALKRTPLGYVASHPKR